MVNDEQLDALRKQLSTLEELTEEVAHQYENTANKLRDGLIPEETPGVQLDAARKVLLDTLSTLSSLGEPFGIASVSEDASLPLAYEYLNRIIKAKEEAERQRKLLEDARMITSEAQALRHNTMPDALNHIFTAVQEIADQLDGRNLEEAERMINGEHPVSMLVAYAKHRASLSDSEYDAFRDHIEEHFGRPILRDLDRGHITHTESVPFINEVIVSDVDEEGAEEEVIDIIETSDESEENSFLTELAEDMNGNNPFDDDTLHGEHELFWPPAIEDESDTKSEESESEVGNEFNSDRNSMTN